MRSTISGSILPVLELSLAAGERVIAETGELSWKSPHVTLRTTTAAAGAKGLFGAMGRAVSGGGLFMTEYTSEGAPGTVAFSAKIPGVMFEEHISPDRDLFVHKHGFVCATEGVSLTTAFQKSFGAGLLGGNGFLMQRVSGQGTAWFELGGEIRSKELDRGEALEVHPGHVGMFESSVGYDIVSLKGVRNLLFGGDGFFLVRLTGPGRIWLQTLTLPNLAQSLAPYLTTQRGS